MKRETALAAALLIPSLLAGCRDAAPAKNIPKPASPVAPKKVDPLVLPKVTFKDITKESGLAFVHANGMKGKKLLPETMGSGVAFLDYDDDGDQDLFLVNSCDWPGEESPGQPKPTQALYRNDGKGHFQDATAEAGLALCCYGQGVAVGDYDNDGDPDIYLTAVGRGFLLRNDGGKFVDATEETGTMTGGGWLSSAAFFDMENDGDLDLFVCRYLDWSKEVDLGQSFQLAGNPKDRAYGPPTAFNGTLCTLLRNDGGKFSDVSATAKIEIRTPDHKVPNGKSLGVAPYDIDGDGFVDLVVANDTVPNFLFKNKGDGTFEEMGLLAGVSVDSLGRARGAMGIDWADFRNDGTLGLAIGNFANEMTALYVSDDPAELLFADLAPVFGLGAPTQPPLKFGLFWFDYDLDGRADLLTTNGHLEPDIVKVQASETYAQPAQLFWNSGRPGREMFVLVGPESAGPDLFEPIVGRGSSFADIDGDGDLDVVLTTNGGPAKLFRNDGGSANRWLRLALAGTKSNQDGIGAKVEVKAGGKAYRRQHFLARSYLSSTEPALTFGLGKDEKVDSIAVIWPSGARSELKDVAPGQMVRIEEPR